MLLAGVRRRSIASWQRLAGGLLVLLSAAPGMCGAAYDPPEIHVTPQDMQALFQCYLDASGSGERLNVALSACDKRALAMSPTGRRHEALQEGLGAAKAEPELRGSFLDQSACGAAMLLSLLCSVLCLRRVGKMKPETDQSYDIA